MKHSYQSVSKVQIKFVSQTSICQHFLSLFSLQCCSISIHQDVLHSTLLDVSENHWSIKSLSLRQFHLHGRFHHPRFFDGTHILSNYIFTLRMSTPGRIQAHKTQSNHNKSGSVHNEGGTELHTNVANRQSHCINSVVYETYSPQIYKVMKRWQLYVMVEERCKTRFMFMGSQIPAKTCKYCLKRKIADINWSCF